MGVAVVVSTRVEMIVIVSGAGVVRLAAEVLVVMEGRTGEAVIVDAKALEMEMVEALAVDDRALEVVAMGVVNGAGVRAKLELVDGVAATLEVLREIDLVDAELLEVLA